MSVPNPSYEVSDDVINCSSIYTLWSVYVLQTTTRRFQSLSKVFVQMNYNRTSAIRLQTVLIGQQQPPDDVIQTVYYQSVDLVYRAQDTTTGTAPGPIQFDKAGFLHNIMPLMLKIKNLVTHSHKSGCLNCYLQLMGRDSSVRELMCKSWLAYGR